VHVVAQVGGNEDVLGHRVVGQIGGELGVGADMSGALSSPTNMPVYPDALRKRRNSGLGHFVTRCDRLAYAHAAFHSDKLGPYEILAPIGNGGMGEVILSQGGCEHPNLSLNTFSNILIQNCSRSFCVGNSRFLQDHSVLDKTILY
jgi:hypothetical protein